MRYLVTFLLLCVPAFADPPATVTHHDGEIVYVTGHEYTDKAVASGSYLNPNVWEDGSPPTIDDNVWIPANVDVLMHGEMEARNIVCEGQLEWLHGAHLTVSTITGLHGSAWYAGNETAGVGYSIDFYGLPFEAGDEGLEFGNGLVWAGSFHQHGYEVPDDAEHLWYYSDGFRHDADYSFGDPGDVFAKVDLDSNSIQWHWTGEGPRPHRMFMHGDSHDSYCSIIGFGRTRTDMDRGPENINSRYPDHFHRTGEEIQGTRHHVYIADFPGGTGCPGWGGVNHSSNVVATEYVACDVHGAGLVCEAQNEVGEWGQGCMAIGVHSTQWESTQHGPWTRGEGIVAAARVLVTGVKCADCEIGVHWLTRGEPYDDGTIPEHALCINPGPMEVSGFGKYGIAVQWTNTAGGQPPLVIRDSHVQHARVDPTYWYHTGYLTSYSSGMKLLRCSAEDMICSVYEKNLFNTSAVILEECAFSDIDTGTSYYTPTGSGHTTTLLNCVIDARKRGVNIVPSKHVAANRIYTLDGNTITAPDPLYHLIDPDHSVYDGIINEVWVDGEQIPYPWQE